MRNVSIDNRPSKSTPIQFCQVSTASSIQADVIIKLYLAFVCPEYRARTGNRASITKLSNTKNCTWKLNYVSFFNSLNPLTMIKSAKILNYGAISFLMATNLMSLKLAVQYICNYHALHFMVFGTIQIPKLIWLTEGLYSLKTFTPKNNLLTRVPL